MIILNDLKYYLRIFQLEGYRVGRFLRFVARNYFAKQDQDQKNKEPIWTEKAKQLYYIAITLLIALIVSLLTLCHSNVISISLIAIFIFNSYLFLILALLLIKPYEICNRLRVKRFIKNKILNLQKNHQLKVIGITGSYGKTSTKIVLGQLLSKSLITPKSYNTLFGIYKVIEYELNSRSRFFICEMGAYTVGDVEEFCHLVSPDITILTGINEQHLERFGSIKNTIKAKFEILATLKPGAVGIVNLDNALIRNNLKSTSNLLIGYTTTDQNNSYCSQILRATDWKIENNRSVFKINHQGSEHTLQTALLGRGHLSNILAGIAVCLYVGETMESIIQRVANLKQVENRLQVRNQGQLTILDDTYSSNPAGFREALDLLSKYDKKRILVTPGIVELGDQSLDIHHQLGILAATACDEVVLVGRSKNIEALKEGILSAGFNTHKITNVHNSAGVRDLLANHEQSTAVILMENDLPDQYL